MVGSDQTPVADGVDATTYRSFGVEIKSRGTSRDWRVYGHNGTTMTYSAWTNTGLTTDILALPLYLSVISDGAGNVTAYLGSNGSRTLSTITTTGAPTATGSSAQAFVDCHVVNSASGTATLGATIIAAKIYSE